MLLVVVCLLTGLGVVALWFYRASGRNTLNANHEAAGQEIVALSAGTQAVLQGLDLPIEIRCYALLDPATVPESVQAFAGRVDQLVSAYEQAANGKLKAVRYNARSDVNTAAAVADGIKPFNIDKGDACYLGLAVIRDGKKELLPRLSPDWEQALESDLSRAIARLINASPPAKATVVTSQVDPAATAEVKRQIPNFASISLEEGSRVLHESALKDFKAAVSEMEVQVRDAEQRFSQASNSEAEQQVILKRLQQLQAERAGKLKQIAAKSAAQIEALRQLKEAAR